ncbi:LPXTG cell wall anchor domain-containing protein [Enterococcus sp. AZ072]|uniref:LPXTG cell wall anchor domain-containing protein n=1 Tax=unclassified Enterococcus TaxID=2608891 RepID=UPI003D2DB072
MTSQIEVFGTLGTEESIPADQPVVTGSTEVESRVYSGRLAQTNDTINNSLIILGFILCMTIFVVYKIRSLEEN